MTSIKLFPTLYKLSKTKKINIWEIHVISINELIYLKINRGQENGKMVVTKKEVKKGKGKKTKQEQAIFEATSKWNNKIKQNGYLQNKEEAKHYLIIKPMLACKFDFKDFEQKTKSITKCTKKSTKTTITFPCFIQPKLDGLRCICYLQDDKVILQSRQMVHYQFLDHIRKELYIILKKLPNNFYFDGELYTNDLPFERIAGLCRLKKELKPIDFKDMLQIKYHIYDCFQTDNLQLTYEERFNIIHKYIGNGNNCDYLQMVQTIEINDIQEIKPKHDLFIKQGFEGLMLRNKISLYELDKRSKHLQKYKEFIEEEFDIIGFEEGSGLFKDTIIWICKTKDNKQFKATPKGTMEYRKQLLLNVKKYIGKQVTVIFQEYTKDGIPRFPIAKAIRENY